MRWNLAQPLDAGVHQGDVGVEATGDGVADEGGTALVEEVDEAALFVAGSVEAGGLGVEESGDGVLFGDGR